MVISGFAASTVWIGSDEIHSQLLYIFCSVIKERLSEKKRKRGDDMQQGAADLIWTQTAAVRTQS